MKIYTRTGDGGETSLFGGGRVPKDHDRVNAYGTVDELNSVLGRAVEVMTDDAGRERLRRLQHDLLSIGSNLATPPPADGESRPDTPSLPTDRIAEMEGWIDEAHGELEPLRAFVLPGGSPGGAALHVARTVCRRAERAVVPLAGSGAAEADVIRYLNRLSDLLFVMARIENLRAGVGDVLWERDGA